MWLHLVSILSILLNILSYYSVFSFLLFLPLHKIPIPILIFTHLLFHLTFYLILFPQFRSYLNVQKKLIINYMIIFLLFIYQRINQSLIIRNFKCWIVIGNYTLIHWYPSEKKGVINNFSFYKSYNHVINYVISTFGSKMDII